MPILRTLKKLEVKILAIILTSLVLLFTIVVGVHYFTWNQRVKRQLSSTINFMQQLVVKDVMLKMLQAEKGDIEEEIQKQVKHKEISSITLADAAGKVLASVSDGGALAPKEISLLVNAEKQIYIDSGVAAFSQYLLFNRSSCRECHPQGDVLGVIQINYNPDVIKREPSRIISIDLPVFGSTIILILVGVSFLIRRIVLIPLRKLNKTIIDVQRGNLNSQVEIPSNDELGQIAKNFNKMTNTFRATTKSLDKRVGELYVLNEVGKAMTSIFDLDELLRLIIILATEELHAETGSLMLIDKATNELTIKTGIGIDEEIIKNVRIKVGEGISGWVAAKGKPLLIDDVEKDQRFQRRRSHKRYDTKSLLSVPLVAHGVPIGVINVNNKRQGEIFTEDDADLLSTLASQAAVAIDNANLHEYLIEKERMDREMEIAHEIQMSLMPKNPPNLPHFNISAVSVPALQVGGDYFDFINIDESTLGVSIGDVSGKGMPAALLMVMARSFLYTEARDTISPCMVLSKVNDLILENKDANRPDMFITMFYCVINCNDKVVTFANAGHDPPLLFSKNSNEPQELYSGDMMVGAFGGIDYREQSLQLQPGDLLLLYTDGIVEARNVRDELFGEERLKKLIWDNVDQEVGEIKQTILHEVNEFVGDRPASDDLTMVLVRYEEEYVVIRILRLGEIFIEVFKKIRDEMSELSYFSSHRKNMIMNNLDLESLDNRIKIDEMCLEIEVQSVLENLPLLESLIKLTIESIAFEDHEEVAAVTVAINEATVNAIKYGCANNRLNKIKMVFEVKDEVFWFTVQDAGVTPFNPEEVANPTSNVKRLFKSSGRGIFMMKTFMDEVSFEHNEHGTKLVMRKSLASSMNEEDEED